MLAIAFGGAYLMYFFILDSQISQLSPDGSQSTVTGQDLVRGVQGATEKAKSTVDKVVAPLEKFKDATVGKAARTRDQMNQSNRETEKVIQKLESQP